MQLSYYKKPKLPSTYTQEFRDPQVWLVLKDRVIPDICSSGGRVIRIWSAGCASGEEVFSLVDLFGKSNLKDCHVSIYGTDIRESKLVNAKMLVADKLENLKPRPNVRFRCHDLAADKPLPLMKLILCRNVLMFFKPIYQDIILQKLYESLTKGGFLVLGRAEYMKGEVKPLFREIDRKNRIFQKI